VLPPMTDREQYDMLTRESDAAYALAGIAMRERDHAEYRRHVDDAWAAMSKATPIFQRLPQDEQDAIQADALLGMATAFVKGLGR
jgi:ABC-type thiamine transport system substrate-binding protein